MDATPTIALLSTDLMFSSSVAGVAARIGARSQVVSTSHELEQFAEHSRLALLLLDLSTPGIDAADVTARMRKLAAPPGAIVAYGPHVHAEKLAAARAAGCDEVLTRGQFHSQMHDLIAGYL